MHETDADLEIVAVPPPPPREPQRFAVEIPEVPPMDPAGLTRVEEAASLAVALGQLKVTDAALQGALDVVQKRRATILLRLKALEAYGKTGERPGTADREIPF